MNPSESEGAKPVFIQLCGRETSFVNVAIYNILILLSLDPRHFE